MALLGNYTVLANNPGKAFSGSTISDNRSQTNKSGANRGRFSGEAGWSQRAGQPDGYRPPYTNVIAIKDGAMSTYTIIRPSLTMNVAGAMGVNAEATIPVSITLSVTGQLVVSAVATISASLTMNASAVGIVNAAANIPLSATVTALLKAKGNIAAELDQSLTVDATVRATGELAAEILPYTELSPEALAIAVWAAQRDANTGTGTHGEALRLVHAILRNRTVTDPVAGTFTVYDDDDVTVLLSGDLWEDADGTSPYASAGAERRDRLV